MFFYHGLLGKYEDICAPRVEEFTVSQIILTIKHIYDIW